MKLLKHFILATVFTSATINVHAVARTTFVINPISSSGVSAWEYYDNQVGKYVIQACIFDGAGWSSPFTISDTAFDCYRPKAMTTDIGTIAVVWEATNPLTGCLSLCGTIYSQTGWRAPAIISDHTSACSFCMTHFITLSTGEGVLPSHIPDNLLNGS